MLQRLGWSTLEQRRNSLKNFMLYKIIHGIVHIDYDEVLTRNENPTRGHSQRYCIPPTRINAYHHSFFPSTIRKWNTLPDCIITSANIELFISNYYIIIIIKLFSLIYLYVNIHYEVCTVITNNNNNNYICKV